MRKKNRDNCESPQAIKTSYPLPGGRSQVTPNLIGRHSPDSGSLRDPDRAPVRFNRRVRHRRPVRSRTTWYTLTSFSLWVSPCQSRVTRDSGKAEEVLAPITDRDMHTCRRASFGGREPDRMVAIQALPDQPLPATGQLTAGAHPCCR